MGLKLPHNVLRAGDRNPVLRLRQGYGACTLLSAVLILVRKAVRQGLRWLYSSSKITFLNVSETLRPRLIFVPK